MTERPMNYFTTLQAVECQTEKKGKLTYISWIEAWSALKAIHPGANYEIHRTPDGSFLHGEGLVMCSVTVPNAFDGEPSNLLPDVTHTMWLPVMDGRNNQIAEPTTTDINKALMRCLAKCIAMHGLGAYVYMGEDLPVVQGEPASPEPVTKDYAARVRDLQQWAGQPRSQADVDQAKAKVAAWPEPWNHRAAETLLAVVIDAGS